MEGRYPRRKTREQWAKPKAKDLPTLQHTIGGQPVFVLSTRHVASLRYLMELLQHDGVNVPGHCEDLVAMMAKLVQARAKNGAGRMSRAEVDASGIRSGAELALATSNARAASVGRRILPTVSRVYLACNVRHYLPKNIEQHGPEVAHAIALENAFAMNQCLRFDNVKMREDEFARFGAPVGMTMSNAVACLRRLRDLTYIDLEQGQDEDGRVWWKPSVRWEALPEFRIRGDATKKRLDREQAEYDLGLRVDRDPALPSLTMTMAGCTKGKRHKAAPGQGLFASEESNPNADTNSDTSTASG
jgi:hypothetical protein